MGRLFSSQFLIRTLWRYTFIDLRFLDGHVAKIDSNRGKNLYQMYLLFIELFIKLKIISKPIALSVIDVMLRPNCCRYLVFDTTLLGSEFSMCTPTLCVLQHSSLLSKRGIYTSTRYLHEYSSSGFYSRKRCRENLAGESPLGPTFLKK